MFGSKVCAGIDIGSTSVKVVQLKRSGDSIELERVGFADIYPGGDRPGDPNEQRRAKIDAVRRALSSANITAKASVSAVNGESIIVRYLQLPEMPEEELKKALQWEAEEYIPFRLDEVNLDSMVLGKKHPEDDRVDVLLVSAKKDLVEEHVSMIREAGLTPKVVDVDSFAFLNCVEANYDLAGGETIALINLGAEITGISIYQDGASRFSRDIPLGGETITNAIQSHLRCSHSEAENLKIIHGATPAAEAGPETTASFSGALMDTIRGKVDEITSEDGNEVDKDAVVSKAVASVLGELISEVRRSIEFFENQVRGVNVARVILGGGTSNMINLRENFEAELNLPTEIIDPLRRIRISGRDISPDEIERMRPALGVGIGLGIRGLAA